jgi:hypothetical protein
LTNFLIYFGYALRQLSLLLEIKRVSGGILILFALLPHTGNAQCDSAYIAPFKQELSAGIYSYYQFTTLTHEVDDDNSITYIPNSPLGFGLSVSYKNFSLSGGMGFRFLRNPKFGKTNVVDWQYHYYGRKFILDVFFQNYKGFYVRGDDKAIIIHPDIKLVQYGLFGQYIFNNKKFSYRAAFNQSERQLKSAGSFQLGGGLYYNNVSSDTSLTINEERQLTNYQLCLSGGYVYTVVIKKNYYAALGVSVGLSLGTESLKIKNVEVSPNMFPRISAGYNSDSWSVGLSFVLNRTYISHNEKLNMLFDTGYAQITFIKRFNTAPKFLHRVKLLN